MIIKLQKQKIKITTTTIIIINRRSDKTYIKGKHPPLHHPFLISWLITAVFNSSLLHVPG